MLGSGNTMKEAKQIKAIECIRKVEKYHYDQKQFCRQHNMKLDEIKHQEIENELRRLATKIEDIFETGIY